VSVPILKQGDVLIASIQSALSDQDLVQLRDDFAEKIGRLRTRGVVIDVTALDVLDSFATRTLRGIAYIAKLLCESGVDAQKSMPRAEFIYWAYVGQSSVMNVTHGTITESDLDDLSGLFTRPDNN